MPTRVTPLSPLTLPGSLAPPAYRPPGSRSGIGAQSVLEHLVLDRAAHPEASSQQRRRAPRMRPD
jgi:hypothetical protein